MSPGPARSRDSRARSGSCGRSPTDVTGSVMATLSCPVCAVPLEQAGYTYRCVRCNGAWIAEDALVGILEERASTLVELPWQPREDQHRACAFCHGEMQSVNLGTVALDRCEAHG